MIKNKIITIMKRTCYNLCGMKAVNILAKIHTAQKLD